MRIAVVGATGRTGRRVVERLCAAGHQVAAVGRDPGRLAGLDPRAEPFLADLDRPETLRPALAAAARVASCAHAQHTAALLEALPATLERLVVMGSVRRYLRIPDPDGAAVAAAEELLAASGRAAVMLHASLIYGAADDGNISRVLALIRRWPRSLPIVLPLPDGGRHLVQPIHVDDVAAGVVAALTREEVLGPPIVLAGPAPLSYADLVRRCARQLGRRVAILPLPTAALVQAAALASRFGLRLPVSAAELRRAGEDKRFAIEAMRRRLGIEPVDFAAGLARAAALAGGAEVRP